MQSTQPTAIQRRRVSGRRTTTGCLCCRLRHKKCDEVKPTCDGCARNNLICSWSQKGHSGEGSHYGWRQRLLSGTAHLNRNRPSRNGTIDQGDGRNGLASGETRSYSRAGVEGQKAHSSLSETSRQQHHNQDKLPVSLNPGHLTLRDLKTNILFLHYAAETARPLCTRRGVENPFVSFVLPRAYSDSLIMSAVIALSGVHFCHKNHNPEMLCVTWMYYAQAVRGLKLELTRMDGDEGSLVRLLFVTILLCHVECVSGNFDGAIFHHLRASRQFVLSLVSRVEGHHDKDACAFLIEMYSYLASISNITFNATSTERTIAYDASIYSIGSWQDCSTYGVMFGYASGLFKLIPQICEFGRDRFIEEANSGGPSASSLASYRDFEAQIRDWKIPTDPKETVPGSCRVAHIYREALLIYLHAGFYASDVTNPRFREVVDVSIAKLLLMLESIQGLSSMPSLCAVLLWPNVILGTCLQLPEQRQHFQQMMRNWPGKMAIKDRAIQLLDWMWEEESDSIFGPYGLEIVMNRHKINFCMG